MSRYFDDDLYHSSGCSEEEITHYGILGMKWGIRRYQPYSYTGGSGKEVGEAKKLAKLSNKSAKLQKKIDKLEKKRTNRFAIATNARYRGQMGDKQQKLIKKKEKIDKKIDSEIQNREGDVGDVYFDRKRLKGPARQQLDAALERYNKIRVLPPEIQNGMINELEDRLKKDTSSLSFNLDTAFRGFDRENKTRAAKLIKQEAEKELKIELEKSKKLDAFNDREKYLDNEDRIELLEITIMEMEDQIKYPKKY